MWLLYGAVIGWAASSLMRQPEGLLLNIIVGVLGAGLAGVILTPYIEDNTLNPSTFSLPAILVSVGGAIILLAALHLFRRWGGLLH